MKTRFLTLFLILSLLMCFPLPMTLAWADDDTTIDDINDEDEEANDSERAIGQTAAEADGDLYGGENEGSKSTVTTVKSPEIVDNFTDVDDEHLANAIGLMTHLSVVSGYEDKTFKPAQNMSRYGFVRGVLKLLNIDPAIYSGSVYSFLDVDKGTTRHNVMAGAVSCGFLTAYSDGSIRPNEAITSMEAVRALMKVTGYSVEAEAKGGKDTDYLQIARQTKLTDGVSMSNYLTRGDAVKLFYNAATMTMMHQVVWGDKAVFSKNTVNTLLSVYHRIYFADGVMNATHIGAIGDHKATEENIVNIGETKFFNTRREWNDYLAYKVTYFYMENNGTYQDLIYLFKHRNVKELIIKADDLISYSDNIFRYNTESSSVVKTAKITADFDFLYNGTECIDYTDEDLIPANGYVKLISNNGAIYDTVFVWEYYNAVVKSVFTSDGNAVISFDYGYENLVMPVTDGITMVDMYNNDDIMDVTIGEETYLDGDGAWQTRVTLPFIDRYSVISVYANKTKILENGHLAADAASTYYRIYLNSGSVTGTVTGIGDKDGRKIFTIDGTDYPVSSDNYLEDADVTFRLGSYGKFRFDCDGKIASWSPEESWNTFVYGYLIQTAKIGGFSADVEAKVLCQDGTIRIYPCASKTNVNGTRMSAAELLNALAKSAKMRDDSNAGFTISQLIKYKTDSSGVIVAMETITAPTGVASGYEDTHLRRELKKQSIEYRSGIGGAYIIKTLHNEENWNTGAKYTNTSRVTNLYQGKPSFFFRVPTSETFHDEDYTVEASWNPDNTSKEAELYDVSELLQPTVVVMYEDASAISPFTYPYMVVTEISTVLNDEGVEVQQVTGYNGTKIRSYMAKDGNTLNDIHTGEAIKKGDFITMGGKRNIIYEVERVTSVEQILKEDYYERETSIIPKYNPSNNANYCAAFEAWDYNDATRGLIVQRGTPTGQDNRREFQKVSWYMTAGVALGGMVTCTYHKSSGKIDVENGAISDIKGARQYGIDNCSKVFLVETNNYTWRITIVVNEMD